MVGCTEVIHNEPVNRPLAGDVKQAEVELGRNVATNYHDTVIALSFSGGGTRAAAFSYGVLTGFDDTHVRTSAGTISLLDHIDFVSGVSGGSVLAAYYGIKKRQALVDFKQRFLLRNAEGIIADAAQPRQHRARAAGRRQRYDRIPALARRQSVRERDIRKPADWVAAADLDQRFRYL